MVASAVKIVSLTPQPPRLAVDGEDDERKNENQRILSQEVYFRPGAT